MLALTCTYILKMQRIVFLTLTVLKKDNGRVVERSTTSILTNRPSSDHDMLSQWRRTLPPFRSLPCLVVGLLGSQ